MAKSKSGSQRGGSGKKVGNAPSKTGNSSGPRRGNAPSKGKGK